MVNGQWVTTRVTDHFSKMQALEVGVHGLAIRHSVPYIPITKRDVFHRLCATDNM